jgi:hypothetical protein
MGLYTLDWFIQFGHLGYICTCCEVGFVLGTVLGVGGRFLVFAVLFVGLYAFV